MESKHNFMQWLDDLIHHFRIKEIFDGLSVGTVFSNLMGWITVSNFALLCTALWSFGRLVEMVTGKPVHVLIADAIKKYKGK